MKKLGRSMAWHHEEDGPTRQVRMFVVGFLSQGSGKLPLAVVKFYDRGLKQAEKIRTNYIGRAINGCDMFWVWIKLPAAGVCVEEEMGCDAALTAFRCRNILIF